MRSKSIALSWSSGKDAAMALYALQNSPDWEVRHLFTTVNKHYDRVSMHGLKRSLLQRQIEQLEIPFSMVELPENPTMEQYDQIMAAQLQQLQNLNIYDVAYGDIFLEDLKAYRDKTLIEKNMRGAYPLWKKDTAQLITDFVDQGFRACIVALNAGLLPESFLGREIDQEFVEDLPEGVDPCGENGEFHTFCFDGPIFNNKVEFEMGERTHREYDSPNGGKVGFWFLDLL